MTERPSGHGAAAILTTLTLGTMRFFVVDQGFVRTVMAFGKLVRLAPPGLHSCLSLWGLYQGPGDTVPTSEQIDPYDNETVFTSDGVKCSIDVMICFRISDPSRALFEVSDYRLAIKNLVQSVLRNECGKLPARAMLASRDQMAKNIQDSLCRDCDPWGIAIRLVEIKNIEMAIQERRP